MTWIVDALATWRLTRLIQQDSFPPAAWLRSHVEARFPEEHPVGEMFRCPWCLSPYVALAVYLARRACPRLWEPVAFALAASAVTGTAETLVP